jgi:hypothetical protein
VNNFVNAFKKSQKEPVTLIPTSHNNPSIQDNTSSSSSIGEELAHNQSYVSDVDFSDQPYLDETISDALLENDIPYSKILDGEIGQAILGYNIEPEQDAAPSWQVLDTQYIPKETKKDISDNQYKPHEQKAIEIKETPEESNQSQHSSGITYPTMCIILCRIHHIKGYVRLTYLHLSSLIAPDLQESFNTSI